MKKHLILILALCLAMCIGVMSAPAPAGGAVDIADALVVTPEQDVTADDAVVAVAKLCSIYNNENELKEDASLEQCYDYALECGIIFDGMLPDNTDEYAISRAELAYMLGKAVPSGELKDINGVLAIPDSDITGLYYEPALMLINAGVIEGIDEYASFGPTLPVKRYELGNIIKRIVNPEERMTKEYIEYASDEPYYLINDYLMGDTTAVRGVYNIASGWRYDYTGSAQKATWNVSNTQDARNGYVNTLRDLSATDRMTISRDIYPQKDGQLVLETSFNINFGFNGFRFYLEDIDGNTIFEMGTRNNYYIYFSRGNGTTYSRYLSSYGGDRKYYLYADPKRTNDSVDSTYGISKQIRARLNIDLDKGTVSVYISGTNYGTYNLDEGYNGLKTIKFSTTDSDKIEYTVKQVHLYKNYKVNDKFITHKAGAKPYDYTTNGSVYVKELLADANNQGDFYSVQMNAVEGRDVYAKKSFSKVGGIVKLESYIFIPEGNDGVYFSAGYDSTPVIKIITKDGKFYTTDKNGKPDRELRFFTPNTWQCIRIEADTYNQTALIKICGKVVAEDVPFLVKTDSFNSLEIGCREAEEDFTFWFDDVEVHELFYDPDDYVPEPVPLDTGDYILSMSICNLWRNGSHYGWSYIEPHAEIQPITGFYDEGNAEAMDWEIKFLAEHGVSTYAMCWYAPTSPAEHPIKKPRMIDAHHEGYFNAKYTDYLDFSIMWENANYGNPGTHEAFMENIFPYWMDWYFSDPRYFRIEEDGKEYLFLTIYQFAAFRNMCLPAKNGAYSSNVTDYYSVMEFNQAEIDAAELVSWMEQQVIDAGYADGIILCFTTTGSSRTTNTSILNIAGSDTAIFPYAWGSTAYDIDTQKQFVENYYDVAQSCSNSLETAQAGAKGAADGLDLLALAAVGFNDIGWAQNRYPLISDEDFEEILVWFRDEYMPRYKNDEDQWKQHFIQFDTWNEYGEGHYIYPTVGLDPIPGTDYKGYGQYGYLEAIAKTFGADYDAELHKELDITPTQEQKSRIGRLYLPNNRMYIRREFLPDDMKQTPIPEHETLSFKFNSAASVKYISWVSGFYANPVYNSRQKAIELVTSPSTSQNGPDPIIVFSESSAVNGINTSDCSVLHIRMKASKTGTLAQVFFRVDTMPKNSSGSTYYSEDYKYSFEFEEADEWHDYYIDLKSHEGFTGVIETIRFDPGSLEDNTIYISDFEFLKFSDEQKRTDIVIDGNVYFPVDYWEIQELGRNEIYIAPTEENNFYKALHIVYDWNENTGILDLDTPCGTTFRFTVGSDKVIVNGDQEVQLAKEFYVYDGAPVIPLIYILNTAGYNYVHDFIDKKLEITVCDPVIFTEFENYNAEDEALSDAFYSLNDSTVSIIEDPEYKYNNLWKITGGDNSNSYFVTDIKYENDANYTISFDINLLGLEGGTYMGSEYPVKLVAIYSNGTQAVEYSATIGTAYYGMWNHIDYSFTLPEDRVYNSGIPEKIGIYIEPDDWERCSITYCVDNFVARRLPLVFECRNGDAEDEDMSMWYSPSAFIERIWDEEMSSWVIEVRPDVESDSAWTYLRQGTFFEPGVTYYYSFDSKMGTNAQGEVVTTSFALNSRYGDLLQQHFTQNHSDHSNTYYGVSQNDGWRHYSGSFTISAGYMDGGVINIDGVWMDEITFYVNPLKVDGVYSPMSIRYDNIKFSTSPID